MKRILLMPVLLLALGITFFQWLNSDENRQAGLAALN